MKKLRVGVLFGGRSGEHEVSLLSAASVLNAIDKSKYEVVPIGITKEGRWVTAAHAERLLQGKPADTPEPRHLRAGDPDATESAAVLARGEGVVVPPMPGGESFLSGAVRDRCSPAPLPASILSMSTSSFPCCMAPSARMAPSRACWSWLTLLTWARACSAPPPAWTKM